MAGWLRNAAPLDGDALLRREGLMPETFEEAARSFVEAIEFAAASSRRYAELSCR